MLDFILLTQPSPLGEGLSNSIYCRVHFMHLGSTQCAITWCMKCTLLLKTTALVGRDEGELECQFILAFVDSIQPVFCES